MVEDTHDRLSARVAVSYALSRDAVLLFGLLLLGRLLPFVGPWFVRPLPHLARGPEMIITTGTSVLGTFVTFLAIVSLAYKILVDTRPAGIGAQSGGDR